MPPAKLTSTLSPADAGPLWSEPAGGVALRNAAGPRLSAHQYHGWASDRLPATSPDIQSPGHRPLGDRGVGDHPPNALTEARHAQKVIVE